jgi:hypothetical protein
MGLKIFHQNLVYNIGDSFTASKEAASMPGANLAGLHPSEPWNCPSYTNAEYVQMQNMFELIYFEHMTSLGRRLLVQI